ncbi:MAG: hypothetical protein IJ852_05950, partial [Alphaproteobacteria bacterium]|nr:hypothetical protein [Alphaproteobacteria bacterium]
IKDDSIDIYDVFKNRIRPYFLRTFMGLGIYLANDNPHEQCVNLYQMIQQYHSFLWLTEVQINSSSLYDNPYYGDKYCGGNYRCIRELTPARISELCRVCDKANTCSLFILWQ